MNGSPPFLVECLPVVVVVIMVVVAVVVVLREALVVVVSVTCNGNDFCCFDGMVHGDKRRGLTQLNISPQLCIP